MSAGTASRARPQLRLIRPTIGGTGRQVVVGGTVWGLAPDWPIVMAEGDQLCYVLAGADLHILNARGEVTGVPDALLAYVKERLFGT